MTSAGGSGGSGGGAGGSPGGAVGGVSMGVVGRGGGIEVGPGLGGLGGAAPISGLARMDQGLTPVSVGMVQAFGAGVKEGQVSRADLAATVPFGSEKLNFSPSWTRAQLGAGTFTQDRPGSLENTMIIAKNKLLDKPNKLGEIRFTEPAKAAVPKAFEQAFGNESAYVLDPDKSNIPGEPLSDQDGKLAVQTAEAILAQARQGIAKYQAPLEESAVVAEAESIVAAARTKNGQPAEKNNQQQSKVKLRVIRPTWEVAAPRVEPLSVLSVKPREPVQRVQPAAGVEAASVVQPKTETSSVNKTTDSVTTEFVTRAEEQEEVAEEKITVGEKPTGEPQEQQSQDQIVRKIKIVRAKEIAQARILLLIEAIKKSGQKFKETLSGNFHELKSPVVSNGKDHTLDLTIKEVATVLKYQTPKQAETVAAEAVENNAPVEEKEEGETATVEEYRKVVHGEQKPPKTPAEVVYKRVVKKVGLLVKTGKVTKASEDKQIFSLVNKTEVKGERDLTELSPRLAETLLQKVA